MHICDFCGKAQEDVKIMIASKNVDICDECVLLCLEIITKNIKESKQVDFNFEQRSDAE